MTSSWSTLFDDQRPRTPLSHRLTLLLSSSSRSTPPRSPPSELIDTVNDEDDMLRTSRRVSRATATPPNVHRFSSRPSPMPPEPLLRWATSRPPSSSSHSSSPSQSLSLLREALTETILPAPPPEAHLPSAFHASRTLTRPPPFFDSLTRSTLPTASLSPLFTPDRQSSPLSDQCPSQAAISHSPPTRSSVDALRSITERGVHTSAIGPTPPRNWWFQSENKDNVDALLHEEDRAETVQQEQDKIRQKYLTPKNPIVFCHGLLGFDLVTIGPSIAPMQVTHWRGITEVLEANGIEVLITRVPATSSVVDRAKVLEQKISEVYPGRGVHLIGHSMGGLDCRYLATHLTDRKFRVLSITTIATPHRGSSFADHFLETVGKARMPSVVSLLDMLPNGGGDGKAFECLTVEGSRLFNESTHDVPGVKYYSWGAVYEPGLIDTWKWPHSVIMEKEGPNDGLVSVTSSKWGTYLGTLVDVNHLDLVGWINTARYKWAEIMGKEIKFRPATFYLGIADRLAREVEEQEQQAEASGEAGEDRSGAAKKDAVVQEPEDVVAGPDGNRTS